VQHGNASDLGRVGGANASSRPLALSELAPRDVAAWRELAEQAAEPNPFFEPECVLPAAQHLGESHVGLLVVTAEDGAWLACMPVRARVQVRHARVPGLTAWRHLYCFLGTPLVARSAVEVGTERLLDQALRASHHGVVLLPWLGDDGPVSAGLLAALGARGRRPALHRPFDRAVMHRPTLDDGVDQLISSRHRRDLGRLARRLSDELGAPLELRDRSDSATGVDEFLALEASGWKGERGTAMASQPAHAAFFTELCDGFRARGRLQLLSLGSSERAVSYLCNLLTGDAVFRFKIAFDESVGHYKPGVQLELQMLEVFRDEMTQTWIDSCAAQDSPQFKHLWPERRPLGSYVVAAHRAVSWTIDRGLGRLADNERRAGA
jgi:CelD/BcsL family acetyltransferase involved in cellulose biosynthesis